MFATYFCQAVGLPKSLEFFAGFGAIALLTFVNLLGVRQGTGTQTVLTTTKVVGILALCAAGVSYLAVYLAAIALTPGEGGGVDRIRRVLLGHAVQASA